MVKTGTAASAFINDLYGRTLPFFEREHAALAAFREGLDGSDELAPWDVAYFAQKQRKALYDIDQEALRPYFGADGVLSGMFELVNRLYGIRVQPDDTMPTWHPSVQVYSVADADGTTVGRFYADLYPRAGKRGGAWMRPMLTGDPAKGTPHVAVMCANVTPAVGDAPALLTHREVETLFHEFGHLLHHLLTEVRVRSLAGTNVAWDFVELPSQIMENWCWARPSLNLFAKHYETGETIPDDLFDRLTRARTFRAGYAQMRQLGFATVDLALHRDYDGAKDGTVLEYARLIAQRFSPTPLPDDYSMIASFTHLFASPTGYAAGYYSYKWAEVLDADAFTRFEQEGLFSSEVGGQFRAQVLSQGNSRDPAELYAEFMGRAPDAEALLRRAGLA
jgi:oligopeptidase A